MRDLVDRARVGDVDADRRRGWAGQRKRIENSQGEIAAPRCLDHKLRVESGPLAVGIDILDAGDRASLIGDEPLDARALSDLDIDVSVQARSREEFDQCARERIRIEPEIPLRERIVAWTLHPNVEADPYRHRPSTGEIAFELRKEFREGALTCFACGTPCRVEGSVGNRSRSMTTTCSKYGASARAAVRPPMPAPMTMARCPMVDIATSRVSR